MLGGSSPCQDASGSQLSLPVASGEFLCLWERTDTQSASPEPAAATGLSREAARAGFAWCRRETQSYSHSFHQQLHGTHTPGPAEPSPKPAQNRVTNPTAAPSLPLDPAGTEQLFPLPIKRSTPCAGTLHSTFQPQITACSVPTPCSVPTTLPRSFQPRTAGWILVGTPEGAQGAGWEHLRTIGSTTGTPEGS